MDYQGQSQFEKNKIIFSDNSSIENHPPISVDRNMNEIGGKIIGVKENDALALPSSQEEERLRNVGTEAISSSASEGFSFETDPMSNFEGVKTSTLSLEKKAQEKAVNVDIDYGIIKNEVNDKFGKVALKEIKKAEEYLNNGGDVADFYKTIREEAMPALLENNYGRHIGKAA